MRRCGVGSHEFGGVRGKLKREWSDQRPSRLASFQRRVHLFERQGAEIPALLLGLLLDVVKPVGKLAACMVEGRVGMDAIEAGGIDK